MKVLVTGASGFVGGHLTNYLADQGLDVHVLIRNPDKFSFSKKITKHIGDITQMESVVKASQGCHTIFHLAGVVGYSKAQRHEMETVNVGGTQNVLIAIEKNKIPKLLNFSSVVAIGASFTPTPLNEKSSYNISHLNLGYFETKRKAEQLAFATSKKRGFECVCVNPSTIYGYGDALKGSRKVQVKVAQGKFPFYTPGGANIICVEDVVRATYQAWIKGISGERYILSGENLYIKDIFEMIARTAGVEPPKIGLPKTLLMALGKVGDALELLEKKAPLNSETAWTSTLYHWFDNSKAKKELGLNPKPAIEGIRNSIQWMKDNGVLNK
jgi:dihydroflavonol-4-reductase